MTNLLSVQSGLPLEESIPNSDPIPLFAPVDIQPMHPILVCSQIVFDGDKRPKHPSGKLFCFVPPSSDHILKMESSRFIDCTILKSMMVPEPCYGVVFTLHILGSILKKELYEVTISDFPACTCIGFRYMCTSTLGNPTKRWVLCKHLYFILQNRMFCTIDDAFIHCPGWIVNEVWLLMSRMEKGE